MGNVGMKRCRPDCQTSRGRFTQPAGIHASQLGAFLADRDYDTVADYAGEISTAR